MEGREHHSTLTASMMFSLAARRAGGTEPSRLIAIAPMANTSAMELGRKLTWKFISSCPAPRHCGRHRRFIPAVIRTVEPLTPLPQPDSIPRDCAASREPWCRPHAHLICKDLPPQSTSNASNR